MRHAVVFGGSNGGIGSALARELARSHRVVVVDLVPPRVELGNSIDFLQCNVAELGDVAKLVPQLSQLVSGRLDLEFIVFSAAVFANAGPTLASSAEDWRLALNVNLMGAVHVQMVFVPLLTANPLPSKLVFVGSLASWTAGAGEVRFFWGACALTPGYAHSLT